METQTHAPPERKNLSLIEVKAVDGGQPGEFEAIVAAYNVDSVGDRIMPGAFARSLKDNGLPSILYSHMWDSPPIGVTLEAKETTEGLYIRGRLFVGEGEDHSLARQVYTAMRAKDGNGKSPLRKFSIGYAVHASIPVYEDGIEIRELHDVELYEVSVVLVPANDRTELLSVKAQEREQATPPKDSEAETETPVTATPEPETPSEITEGEEAAPSLPEAAPSPEPEEKRRLPYFLMFPKRLH